MRILLTGAAGFIGSNLAEALIRRGDEVLGFDDMNGFLYDTSVKEANLSAIQKNDIDGRFRFMKGDIRDAAALEDAFSAFRPEVVVHLAAYAGVRPSLLNPALYYDVNVMGTLQLISAMVMHDVKRMVFASSSSVYGANEKVPFSESDFVDNPISPYAATKKAGELLLYTYYSQYGVSTVCLRFFTVYGRRQRPDLAIAKFSALMRRGKPIDMYGDGETRRDYTYIDDILDGVIKSIDYVSDQIVYEVFNLGESKTVSLKEMIQSLSKALGVEPVIRQMPLQPGDVLRTYADVSKAKKLLGYDPRTEFSEGVSRYVEYLEGWDE